MTPPDAPAAAPVVSSSVPVLGLAEAAKACGLSVSTLRRRRADLVAAGAVHTSTGWRIPVPVLVSLGLLDRVTAPDAPARVSAEPLAASVPAPGAGVVTPPDGALQEELRALRSALAAAEQRAAVAEAVAAERDRLIRVQERALLMLEAGPSAAAVAVPAAAPSATPEAAAPAAPAGPVRRWWRR